MGEAEEGEEVRRPLVSVSSLQACPATLAGRCVRVFILPARWTLLGACLVRSLPKAYYCSSGGISWGCMAPYWIRFCEDHGESGGLSHCFRRTIARGYLGPFPYLRTNGSSSCSRVANSGWRIASSWTNPYTWSPSFGTILRRTSKTLLVKLEMSPLPTSIVICQTQGMSYTSQATWYKSYGFALRVIEYPTRDEADGAIRDLDGKEIRGVSVRVSLDDVSTH